ncbi:inner membrane protein [Escherichia coli]|nr:inner membrane protein [Escherichia coli]
MSKDYMADGSLTEKWKYRFSFYDEHGFPGFWGASPEYKQALKGLNTRQKGDAANLLI